MKKYALFITLSALMITGSLFHSCQKDQMQEEKYSFDNMTLKEMSDFDLPIYMGQTTWIGSAEITHDPEMNMVYVNVNLDGIALGDWYVTEAHLYAGPEAPPKNAPGQFPYHWYLGDDYPIVFDVDGPDWECPGFTWYYALHLELEMIVGYDDEGNPIYAEESAWLLPEEGGIFWLNKKGKAMGWGQYFTWEFDYRPVFSAIDLEYDPGMASVDPPYWVPSGITYPVGGAYPDYTICLDETIPFYFFFIDGASVSVPLEMNTMNEFYIEEVEDPDFWDYWDNKGVNELADPDDWTGIMWKILNAEEGYPMFYLTYDGTDYLLIDGLLYLWANTASPLRISGDYPPDTYYFTGTVMGEYCESEEITISLEIACP